MNIDLSQYKVIEYEHIDDYRCFKPLENVFYEGEMSDLKIAGNKELERIQEQASELRKEISNLFKSNGWEGDGDINCIFIAPPFSSRGWTNCEIVFHVKQTNNGTSFLAIPKGFKSVMPSDY